MRRLRRRTSGGVEVWVDRRRTSEGGGGMGGRREKVRGVYRFSSLVKQNKKAKICFVIYIAGERFLFLYL